MAVTTPKEAAARRINLRISNDLRDLIDSGAKAAGKDRTTFMLEAAREKAINALLDQRLFEIDERDYQQVKAVFDQRLSDNPAGAELMARRPQWESEHQGS